MTSGAIESLMQDHRLIEKVLDGLGSVGERLRKGDDVDVAVLREAARFMREFVDGCHHRKEEEVLFPALIQGGVPDQGGPVGVMKHEHEQGRAAAAAFAAAIERYATDPASTRLRLSEGIEGIRELYAGHIAKEDRVLFPLAERILPVGKLRDLLGRFEEVETESGPNFHERFEELAARMKEAA